MSHNIKLISASAGSGKTYRLTEELSHLLNGGSNKSYHPSQVIATTFTRAAAAELKNKVREKLLQSEGYELAATLDQSLISTVNSIGGQLLSLFAFEMGLSPTLQVIDEEESNVLFSVALNDSLDMEMLDEMDALGERFSIGRDEIIKVIQNISNTARNNAISGKDLKRSADDSIKALKCCLPPADKHMAKTKAALLKEMPRLRKIVTDQNDATISTQSCLTSIDTFLYYLNHHDTIPWAHWGALSSINCGAKSRKAGVFEEWKSSCQHTSISPNFKMIFLTTLNFALMQRTGQWRLMKRQSKSRDCLILQTRKRCY